MSKNNSRVHAPDSSVKPSSTGPKIYAFWILIILVCLLAWANMILTVVVFRVLHLGQGMESLELIPDKRIIKFYGESFFGDLFKQNGKIEGFGNTPFEINGRRGAVLLEVEDNKGKVTSSLKVEQNGTHIMGVKEFIVGNAFSTNCPHFRMSKRARNLEAQQTTLKHITSENEEKLVLRSDLFTKLSGSEGTTIDSKEITLTADQQVILKSINSSVILIGRNGVRINLEKIPIVPIVSSLSTQYKVCVCMPEGKLFRVPVSNGQMSHHACHNIDLSPNLNPCM